jgi:hypothetical protein
MATPTQPDFMARNRKCHYIDVTAVSALETVVELERVREKRQKA